MPSGTAPGAPGVVTRAGARAERGPGQGPAGRRSGDWDVALFDADGHAVAGAASPDAQEVALGWVFGARHADRAGLPAHRRRGVRRDASGTRR